MSLPVMEVPAPWATGVVLNLVERAIQPLALPPAVYAVRQTPSQGDMLGACEQLARLAREKGLPSPAEAAPWGAVLYKGTVGTVAVIRAEPRHRGGWWVRLGHGQPDWSHLHRFQSVHTNDQSMTGAE